MNEQENRRGILGPSEPSGGGSSMPVVPISGPTMPLPTLGFDKAGQDIPLDDIRRLVEYVAADEEKDFRSCDDPARRATHIYNSVVKVRFWLTQSGGAT
jgi:hypothetical protein